MPADEVLLTDLEVIQRYSLAVRGTSASREELVAALESDLAWLTEERPAAPKRRRTAAPAEPAPARRRRAAAS